MSTTTTTPPQYELTLQDIQDYLASLSDEDFVGTTNNCYECLASMALCHKYGIGERTFIISGGNTYFYHDTLFGQDHPDYPIASRATHILNNFDELGGDDQEWITKQELRSEGILAMVEQVEEA